MWGTFALWSQLTSSSSSSSSVTPTCPGPTHSNGHLIWRMGDILGLVMGGRLSLYMYMSRAELKNNHVTCPSMSHVAPRNPLCRISLPYVLSHFFLAMSHVAFKKRQVTVSNLRLNGHNPFIQMGGIYKVGPSPRGVPGQGTSVIYRASADTGGQVTVLWQSPTGYKMSQPWRNEA